MRLHSVTLSAALAIGLCAIPSQAQSKIEIYGGYSYLRPPFTQTEAWVCLEVSCPAIAIPPMAVLTHPNLNGWGFSGAYMAVPWLGVKADFSGHYGAALGSTSADIHTFLLGPEARRPGRVSPFAHLLLGAGRASSSGGTFSNNPQYDVVLGGNEWAFASALGGGIDVKVRPSVWVRLIQVDDLVTRFHSSTQNQLRVSVGLVVRL